MPPRQLIAQAAKVVSPALNPDSVDAAPTDEENVEALKGSVESLRKAAGYTQVEFAAEVGITKRTVAYYEAPGAQPPAHLLPQMAQALCVGADVLLGMAQRRKVKRLATNSLERRLLEIEKLDPKAKRQITQLLDAFIEREKHNQRVIAQAA